MCGTIGVEMGAGLGIGRLGVHGGSIRKLFATFEDFVHESIGGGFLCRHIVIAV
jgi:hypothetical protein